jgi:hypothetical protein
MSHEQSTTERNLIGRRQALCTFAGVATAVAGIGLFGVGTAQAAQVPTRETVTAEEAAREASISTEAARERALVEALIPADLDLGRWSLERAHEPRHGAIAVVLRTPEGKPFQVDVLRRDDEVSGVADTRNFSLFVANQGDGSVQTDELEARGAKVLAHHIRRTELSGAPLPKLLSFRQRARKHPFGDFGVLD